MRILFIVNPVAGANRAPARWEAFQSRFVRSGARLERVFTHGPGEARQLAQEAAESYELLVAAGGDGTAGEVAAGILSASGQRAALGVLALGTGNDVATALGVPTHELAIRSFTAGQLKPIDVVEVRCQVNGAERVRHALLFAGVGIISEVLKRTTPGLKRVFGQRLAYPAGLVRALWSYRCPEMKIRCDEDSFRQNYLFVGASNTPIAGGGMRIAPGAMLDDGLLNVNLVEALGRWRALLQLRRLCRGRHIVHPRVRYRTARSLEVQGAVPLEVAADGDLIGHTPARISVQPKALRVALP